MEKELFDPKRHITLEGAFNFRDLGGYSTAQGRKTRWGMVYRTDSLERLTEKDLSNLAERNIKSYIDFRTLAEKEKAPDKRVCTLQACFELETKSGNMIDLQSIKDGRGYDVMLEVNRNLVREDQPGYTKFFSILQDKKNAPLLFHCTAGKDRAGLAAALFLSSLGVPRETVFADFMLSAKYILGKYGAAMEKHPVLKPVLTVEPEYIEAAYNIIDAEYNGVESFLQKRLSVNLDLMREMYTE